MAEPMRPGNNRATIVSATVGTTVVGKTMYKLRWENRAGREAYQNMVVSPGSERGMAFWRRICGTLGVDPEAEPDALAAALVGVTRTIEIERREYGGSFCPRVRWVS